MLRLNKIPDIKHPTKLFVFAIFGPHRQTLLPSFCSLFQFLYLPNPEKFPLWHFFSHVFCWRPYKKGSKNFTTITTFYRAFGRYTNALYFSAFPPSLLCKNAPCRSFKDPVHSLICPHSPAKYFQKISASVQAIQVPSLFKAYPLFCKHT